MDGWNDLSEAEQIEWRDEAQHEGMTGYQWYRHCMAIERKERKTENSFKRDQAAFRPDLEHELAASED